MATGPRHKPLLLLYALGHFQRHGPGPIPFSVAEERLGQLLREFGPPRNTSAAYPFHHLTSDGVWVVETAEGSGSPGTSLSRLRELDARGRLSPDLTAALLEDPRLLAQLARSLLDANFEPSLHADICLLTGLALAPARRDPGFRDEVLMAYEYRCAFCGYDGWLDGVAVALDAAHVRWWAFGGPDEPANGICACALHHKLFDKGVLGLTASHRVAVSAKFVGRASSARSMVLDLRDRPIHPPQAGFDAVGSEHIDWHREQVFRPPQRQG